MHGLHLLSRQVDRDCEFLEAEKIMDYSLLIGLHFRDDCPSNERGLSPTGILFLFSNVHVLQILLFVFAMNIMNKVISTRLIFTISRQRSYESR